MTIVRIPSPIQNVPLGESSQWIKHTEDLQMSVPHLIWACGETFDQPNLSISSELLRFGFKEWAGIKHQTTVAGVDAQGALTRHGVDELMSLIEHHPSHATLPIVLCRDVHAPARIVERVSSEGRCSLGFLGAPEDPEMRIRRWPFCPPIPPIPMPAGMTPDQILWFGVSPGCESDGTLDTVSEHLQWGDMHLYRETPLGFWLVVHLDRLRLGRGGPGYLDESLVAALCRWAQSLCVRSGVILLSERKSAARFSQLGAAAQVIGKALHRSPQKAA